MAIEYSVIAPLSRNLETEKMQPLRRLRDPFFLFVMAMAGYVLLQVIAVLTSSGLFKALSYLAAFVIVLVMSAVAAYLPRQKTIYLGFGFALLIYFYGFLSSGLFHFGNQELGTSLKMMMTPPFVLIGAAFESQSRGRAWEDDNIKRLFGLLVILPLLLWFWQLTSGQIAFGAEGAVSIFANRNNAGLYAVTLVALLNVLRPQPIRSFFIYFLVGSAFGTLGVLLAVFVALTLTIGRLKLVLLLSALIPILVSLIYIAQIDYGIFGRFQPVVSSIKLIYSGRIDISTVSYGDLVNMLQTKDLSFIFRLKHWLDLWSQYISAPIENIIFGFGVGSSARLSDAALIPHNDYLRMLFECGPVALFGFVTIVILLLRGIGRQWSAVPIVTVVIYFFTENLVDNFAAMSIFFFCGGVLAYRTKYEEQAQEQALGSSGTPNA